MRSRCDRREHPGRRQSRQVPNKYGLKFALAAETDGAISKAYGANKSLGPLSMAARVSYLVAPDGKIAHVWPQVSPAKHAEEVLETVKRLSQEKAGVAS